MITLKEAKNYLRVDYEEDDSLIQNLLSTAKNLVMDVGRMDEDNYYNTMKNKKNTTEKLELSKYCPFCRKHTKHVETK